MQQLNVPVCEIGWLSLTYARPLLIHRKTICLSTLFLLSNLGFALLGQVLGQRFGNGRGFQGWMRENLFSALGMTDTTFTLDERYQRVKCSFMF